ncbi:MAG: pyridoxamine 5'-phosphate oxidase family protein [Acetobacteraceae bacterium]
MPLSPTAFPPGAFNNVPFNNVPFDNGPFHGGPFHDGLFHHGEQAMQTLAGVRERMDQRGARAIRTFMPDQHRAFFAELALLPLAVCDDRGWPAATILTGAPGFVASPDPRTLRIALAPDFAAPPGAAIGPGVSVGLLGIVFATRRRNRMNGRVTRANTHGFDVTVVQSFGNCAQYIQARDLQANEIEAEEIAPASAARALAVRASAIGASAIGAPARAASGEAGIGDPAGAVDWLAALDPAARRLVTDADTMFVASAERPGTDAAIDISHRGGRPGFLRLDGEVLTVPEFAGNRYFNTLGNFRSNPRAALLVPDFATGTLLHLAGTVELVEGGSEVAAFRGAERLWRVRITAAWRRPGALPHTWSPPQPAPTTTATGSWTEITPPPPAAAPPAGPPSGPLQGPPPC